MLDGSAVVAALETCGVTHLVWIPDSHLGTWESALIQSTSIQLIRPTREGEAIAIAGGLMIGGAKPVVAIQCTGLFEAGDALRNIAHDMQLPLIMIVGVRSWFSAQAGKSNDTCPTFTEPILQAWQIPMTWLNPQEASITEFIATLRTIQRSRRPGVILIPE